MKLLLRCRRLGEFIFSFLVTAPTPQTFDESGDSSASSALLVLHIFGQRGESDVVQSQVEKERLAWHRRHRRR